MAKRDRSTLRPQLAPSTAVAAAVGAGRTRRFAVAIALAVVAVGVGVADGPVVKNGWVSWDDHATLYDNPDFNPPKLQNLGRIWHEPRGHLFVPVTYSYWWAWAAATWNSDGLSPAVFHAASLVLHLVASWLEMGIALRLTGSVPAACAGALLFAVHPVQVESVAWASGAKDVLAGALSLAALYCMLMRHGVGSRRGRGAWIVVATLAYVLAMLAKPSSVVLPLILIAIDWLAERRFTRGTVYLVASWLLLALPVVVLTRTIQQAVGVMVPSLWQRPLVALDALGFYVRQLVWPTELAFVYGRTPDVQLASPWANVLVAVVAAIAIAWAAWHRPAIAASTAIFVAALMPYLGLVPFDFQLYSTVADHYLYLAMLSPAVALAYFLRDRSGVWWSICAVLLVALAITSNQQTRTWRSPMANVRHAVAVNPEYAPPHAALGMELMRRNELAEAEQAFRRALEIAPQDAESQTQLAHLLSRQQRYGEALEHYEQALAITPHDTLRMNNLAIALAGLGRIEESMKVLRTALEEDDPTNDDLVHGNLGKLLLSQGRRDEARAEFERALAINPELEIAKRGMEQLERFSE